MPSLAKALRDRSSAWSFAVLLATGCASSSPPSAATPKQVVAAPAVVAAPGAPALLPAELSRTSLVSAVTVSHFSRSLEVVSKLGGLVSPLPLDPNNLTAMLAQQLSVSQEAVSKLDVSKGAAAIALGNGADKDASWVLALPARSAADAALLPGLLGVVEERRGPLVRIKPAQAPSVWAMPSGSHVILASDVDALGRGTLLSLQMASVATPIDDATVVFWPAAMAKEKGVELRSAMPLVIDQLVNGLAENGTHLKPEQRALIETWAGDLAETQQIEIGARLDEARGVSLQVRFVPLAGSKFEASIKEVHAVALDPAVLFGPSGFAMGLGDISMFRGIYQASSARLKAETNKAKGAAAAGKLLDAALDAMTGANSATGGFRPALSVLSVFDLKDPASAATLESTLLATRRDALVALSQDQDPLWAAVAPSLVVKKETLAKTKVLHVSVSLKAPKSATPKIKDMLEVLRRFYGDKPQLWVTVKGQKLLMAAGETSAREALGKALLGGTPPPPNPALAEALSAEKGHGALVYLDLRDALGVLSGFKTGALDDKKIAGLLKAVTLPLPVYGSGWGDTSGRVLTWDVVFPRGLLENVGKTLPALIAMFNH